MGPASLRGQFGDATTHCEAHSRVGRPLRFVFTGESRFARQRAKAASMRTSELLLAYYSAATIVVAPTGREMGSARPLNRRHAILTSRNSRTQALGALKWEANSRSISSGCQ